MVTTKLALSLGIARAGGGDSTMRTAGHGALPKSIARVGRDSEAFLVSAVMVTGFRPHGGGYGVKVGTGA